MSKLSSILETVSSNYKKGTIDMHLYTDDKPIVTFKENDK
jgi:cell division protein FtsQ